MIHWAWLTVNVREADKIDSLSLPEIFCLKVTKKIVLKNEKELARGFDIRMLWWAHPYLVGTPMTLGSIPVSSACDESSSGAVS